MKKLLFLLTFIAVSLTAQAANSVWAGTYQGTASDKIGTVPYGSPYTIQLAIFNDGSFYVFTYLGTTPSSISAGACNAKGVFEVQTVNLGSNEFYVNGSIAHSGSKYKVTYTYPTQYGTATGTGLLTKQH
jgi:hypothetical protein